LLYSLFSILNSRCFLVYPQTAPESTSGVIPQVINKKIHKLLTKLQLWLTGACFTSLCLTFMV